MTILNFFNFGRKVEFSDLAQFFQDGTKVKILSEIQPPLRNRAFLTHSKLSTLLGVIGGFHLVAKIIRELKSHMITYKFKCSHWLKLQHSDWRAILATT